MYRIGQEEIDAVARAINSKDFFKINGSGQEVLHFENEWKSFVGSDYALLMTSGYAAIVSALIGIGVGPGDEVIVPAYTYIATSLAVLETGAIPVIADADETLTIDAEDVKRKIERQKEKYGWEFLFLAANIDAVETAGRFGIASDRAVDYQADGAGTELNFRVLSETITKVRKSMPINAGWKQEIEQDYRKRHKK